MASSFHASFRNSPPLNALAYPIFDIRASATDWLTVLLIEVMTQTNSGALPVNNISILPPASIGVALPNEITFVSDRGLPLPGATIGTEWSAFPVNLTKPNRRVGRASETIVNNGYLRIMPPNGFRIAPGGSLVWWQINGQNAATCSAYFVNLEVEA